MKSSSTATVFKCTDGTGGRRCSPEGYDWSARVKPIVEATYQLNTRGVILDGQVVIMTPEGRSDCAALESSMPSKAPSPDLRFYVFDILHLESFDLRGCSLLDRKIVLKAFWRVENPSRLMVEAEFLGKTGEGLIRHPAFKGIRRDL
jgi:bifunctional non-homologous end joining protein LigD